VVLIVLEELPLKGVSHLSDQFLQPGFNLWINLEGFDLDHFLVFSDQVGNLIDSGVASSGLLDLESVDTFEHLRDVLKNGFRILGLANDLQEIIIGQEIESRELSSLGFQELVQVLLDLLKFLVEVIEEVQEALHNQALLTVFNLGNSLHFCLEDLIVPLEDRVLIR